MVPCWWGYKWVKFVEAIEVVDYDHRCVWENRGYPDYAEIPGCFDGGVNEYSRALKLFSSNLAISGLTLLGVGISFVILLGRR